MKSINRIKIIVIVISVFAVCCAAAYWIARPLMFNPVKISIELKADRDDMCQVFYNYGKGFSNHNSIIKNYRKSNNYQRLDFSLPRRAIGHLRIDPGGRAIQYEVRRIQIHIGNTVVKYTGKEIAEDFEFNNLQLVATGSDKSIKLLTGENPDAQIVYRHVVSQKLPVINYGLKRIMQLSFISLFLTGAFLIVLWGKRIFGFIKNEYAQVRLFSQQNLSAERLLLFVNNNKGVIIFSFLVAIFTYGYELFNFTLSIDEEIDSFRTAAEATVYLDVGRWGIYFLNQVLTPESLMPYFPFLMAITFLATSAILFITHFKFNFFAKLIFSTVFITHPIHTYYLGFNTSAMYYGVGMVLTALSFLAYNAESSNQNAKHTLNLLSVLLLIFALSLYQSHLTIFLVMGLFSVFYHQFHNPDNPARKAILQILRLLAIIVVAVILHQVINLFVKDVVLGNISGGQNEYFDKMFAWNNEPFEEIITSVFLGIKKYLTGRGYFGGVSTQSLVFIFPLILIYIVKIGTGINNKMFMTLVFLMLIIAPFAIVILNGTPLPVRTLMALPLMLGILWAFSYENSAWWLRRIMFIFIVFVLLNNTYTNTRLFYASRISWQADRNMAIRITERIYNLDLPEGAAMPPVAFVGSYQHPSNDLFIRSSIHGASFFYWDKGAHYRIKPFFKTLGINDLRIIKYPGTNNLNEVVRQMPSWPDKGSVKLGENLIIVKLSNPQKQL